METFKSGKNLSESSAEMQYACSAWTEGGYREDRRAAIIQNYQEMTKRQSELAKAKVNPCELNIAYGPESSQKYDLYGFSKLDEKADTKIVVFVHGGYWVGGSRENSAWLVEPLFEAGIVTAVIGYRLAPSVTLDEIVSDVTEAIKSIRQKIDGGRLWLCGHSAGAHLITAAVAMAPQSTDLQVEGLFAISGIYDLEPLAKTTVAREANIDINALLKNSVVDSDSVKRLKARCRNGIVLAVGGFESPLGFIWQTNMFAEILRQADVNVREIVVPNEDHFSVIQKLAEQEFTLTKDLIACVTSGL